MLLSTSPNEFFAMQRYEPMSSFWNFRIVTVMRVSYSDNGVSCTLYLGDETIISPVERRTTIETKETPFNNFCIFGDGGGEMNDQH